MTEVCPGVANLRNKPPDLNERYKFKGPLESDFASGISLINKVQARDNNYNVLEGSSRNRILLHKDIYIQRNATHTFTYTDVNVSHLMINIYVERYESLYSHKNLQIKFYTWLCIYLYSYACIDICSYVHLHKFIYVPMDIKACLHRQIYTHMHAPTYIISFYILSEFDFDLNLFPLGLFSLGPIIPTDPVRGSIFF